MEIQGKVWKYGDDINTDVIIPARYATNGFFELGKHCMEDLDDTFVKKVQKGDIIVAGKNFGCGSSRQHAPIAIQSAGISCVIAESFARIFFRNAINMAFPIFEMPEARRIREGDVIRIDAKAGKIENITRKEIYQVNEIPDFLEDIFNCGGLISYIKEKDEYEAL